MFAALDRVSAIFHGLAAVIFLIIGLALFYEVVARNVFVAPTTWAEEFSRLGQIWATYLAAAYVHRSNDMIAVTLVYDRLGPAGRRMATVISSVTIAVVCTVGIWLGIEMVLDSIIFGRRTASVLSVPMWWFELPVPIGLFVVLLQALTDPFRPFPSMTPLAGPSLNTEDLQK